MIKRLTVLFAVLAMAVGGVGAVSATTMTTFADLGNTLPGSTGTNSMGFALNTSGTVAGYATTVPGGLGSVANQGFTYVAPGPMSPLAASSVARGIYDGKEVGYYPNSYGTYDGFLYSGGTTIDLGGGGSSTFGYAYCVNSNNIVGGKVSTSNAAIWFDPINNPTTYTDLRTLLVSTYGAGTGGQATIAMNSGFALVGYSSGAYTKSCIYNLTTHAFITPTIPGLGGSNAFGGSAGGANGLQGGGTGISSNFDNAGHGWIAGAGNDTTAGNTIKAYIGSLNGSTWSMTRLGGLGGNTITSRAYSVNATGDAVGWSYLSDGATTHAFVYTGGTMYDLNTLYAGIKGSFTFVQATDINDNGWITGYGTDVSGNTHGFLLYTVPEPSTLLLAAAGVVGLLACAWRKRK